MILSAELLSVPDALATLPVPVLFVPLLELTLSRMETNPVLVAEEAPEPAEPDTEATS
jgi:hypothetical protein